MSLKMTDIITEDCIKTDLKETDWREHIAEMVDILIDAGEVDVFTGEDLIEHIIEHEEENTSALGGGVSVIDIHNHEALQKTPLAVLGISPEGIDMNALDGQPVYVSCLVLGKSFMQLQAISDFSDFLNSEDTVNRVKNCNNAEEVYKIIQDFEESRDTENR